MYCPICHIAATVGDSLQIDACRHLEAAFRCDPEWQGGLAFVEESPEYNHYVTYCIVQLDDALIRLRRHIWGDEPPDVDDPYADRTGSALEALGFEAENVAPCWFQPFKAGGLADSDEYTTYTARPKSTTNLP